jgi:hypothetical protein
MQCGHGSTQLAMRGIVYLALDMQKPRFAMDFFCSVEEIPTIDG